MSDNETPKKLYKLLDADGEFYYSEKPGTCEGWTTGKIYHRSDCKKVKTELALGHLKETRVLFKNEATAVAAGYRPCYFCLREKYTEWKQRQSARATKIKGRI